MEETDISSQSRPSSTQSSLLEVAHPENEEIQLTDQDERNIYMQLVVTELQVLYSENIARVSERNTLLLSIVTIAGALLSIGVQKI